MGSYIKDKDKHWWGAKVPYHISPGVVNIPILEAAIRVWNNNTVVRLVERNNENDYIEFVNTNDSSSSSDVGRQGEKQEIKLSGTLPYTQRTAIHEIGHAIGLEHEHQRPDRDRYVKVYKNRILENKWHNFEPSDSGTHGAYDYQSRMHYSPFTFAKNLNYHWSDGWSTLEFYQIGGKTFRLIMKKEGFSSEDKNIHIAEMNTDGSVGNLIDSRKWSEEWTQAKPFSVGTNQFIFFLKEEEGRVGIRKINSDGKIGNRVTGYDWSDGWSTLEFYQIGGKTFRLIMKKEGFSSEDKNIHIAEMNTDGSVGNLIDSRKWSEEWTQAKPFSVGTNQFIFFLKEEEGRVGIRKINSNGKIGNRVTGYDWSDGWSTLEFYQIGGNTYRLIMKKKGYSSEDKNIHIAEMNTDGSVGNLIDSREWSEGWTQAKPFSVGTNQFIFFLKEEEGRVGIREINSNGKIGDALLDIPTMEALHGNVINSTNTLTNTDMETANLILNGNLHVREILTNGKNGSKIDVRGWSNGWTQAKPFSVGTNQFIFFLKEEEGRVGIRKINSDGKIGNRVTGYDWSDGWSTLEFYQIGGKTFRLIMKKEGFSSEDKNIHIAEMNTDGSVGNLIDSRKWSEEWTQAKPFSVGTNQFIFFLKEEEGRVGIRKINSDGKIGNRVTGYDWSDGWSTLEFYQIGGNTYRLIMKKKGYSSEDKNIHIAEMNTDGSVGNLIDSREWSEGWTQAKPFSVGTNQFIFFLKEEEGRVTIRKINSDGKIGNKVTSYDWSSGWTTSEFYQMSGNTYRTIMKK